MPPRNRRPNPAEMKKVLDEARRKREEREGGYREKALKLFPHVCGRCGRDFTGKNLRELTVHHRDNDHFNNPPDGSNWELLCLYCHDDEHQKSGNSGYHSGSIKVTQDDEVLGTNPFAALKDMLETQEE